MHGGNQTTQAIIFLMDNTAFPAKFLPAWRAADYRPEMTEIGAFGIIKAAFILSDFSRGNRPFNGIPVLFSGE